MPVDLNAIVTAAGAVLPGILALVRQRHEADNPGAPPLTDAQVFAGLARLAADELAKDDALMADIRRRNSDVGSDVPGGGAT